MTTAQFRQAFQLAQFSADLSGEEIDHFGGFALPGFEPVPCTVRQVARLIRWQCQYLGGGWDMEAAREIQQCGRRRFVVVDPTPSEAIAQFQAMAELLPG